MFFQVHVFLTITLKTFLKVLLCVSEGFVILMIHLKSVAQNYFVARDDKPGKVKKQICISNRIVSSAINDKFDEW